MTPAPTVRDRDVALLAAARARPLAPAAARAAERVLMVDVALQRLAVIERGVTVAEYPVSTAAAGIGGAEGSNRTPPGWHRIARRIGGREPSGRAFESREPVARVWQGEVEAGDLILTRILTLDGLEDGINRGASVDSIERYIYIHGTNHETRLGQPESHGCVRMANRDVTELFERVAEGDLVVVVDSVVLAPGPAATSIPDPRTSHFHYAGLGGSGMTALAQFQAMLGGRVSGSDRAFDRGERPRERGQLAQLGIGIARQDGSGVTADCAALVVSTAVEESVPDVAAARKLDLPIIHRSELLAHFVHSHRTIAVTGTSGKSTVVAMIFDILRGAGRDPSVITGAELSSLQAQDLMGNAWHGSSNLLVVEADESDGSVIRYHPAVGVVLNLQKDHKAMDEVAGMFEMFGGQVRETLVLGAEANLEFLASRNAVELPANVVMFGYKPSADLRGDTVLLNPDGSRFVVSGVPFTLPVPGRHNVENALAAIAACRSVGVPIGAMVEPLAGFRGVGRRFETIGAAGGVEVVDDFAHNPAKIEAAIATARARSQRVLAIYQPHGFGPTRFLRPDLVTSFANALRADDLLWLLEIYYAGGTAQRDLSSADLVAEIAARGRLAEFAPSREWLVERIAAVARAGDLVLIMGARDPSLTDLARGVLRAIGARHPQRA